MYCDTLTKSVPPEDLPKYWSEEIDFALENLCWAASEVPTSRLGLQRKGGDYTLLQQLLPTTADDV